tara:strand:+ start:1359 stop:1559 length:201 start_codon:yes stop_codon:yes gene_type:complete
MRIEITAYANKDEDGFEGMFTSQREDVDDLQTFAQQLTDFARSIGYSYVVNVGFEVDDGSVTFGTF